MRFFASMLAVLLLVACQQNENPESMKEEKSSQFDWQGHRGARGLVPENSIPSFLKAMEFPVTTLELDVAISKDNKVIVSHEPWMSHHICTKPDSTLVTEEEAMNLRIFEMDYEEIKRYDAGLRGNERFPDQVPQAVHKPSLDDLVQAVKTYCQEKNLAIPKFNIEIKSHPKGDSVFTPTPDVFSNLLLESLERNGIYELSNIQSFDLRPLQYIRKVRPDMPLALLIENEDGIHLNLERLGFIPEIYSPYHILLSKESVDSLHQKNMKVIPWTVNKKEEMEKLVEIGVDGIITDYPNLIFEVKK